MKFASDQLNASADMIEDCVRKKLPLGEWEGEGCRGLREQHFISLSALAAKSNRSEETVALYESGGKVSAEARQAIGFAMADLIRARAIHFAMLGVDSSRPN